MVRSDKSRFRDHLFNEHGVFFDHDYLLASSMMDPGQKETVARTVSNYYAGVEYQHQDYNAAPAPAMAAQVITNLMVSSFLMSILPCSGS